MLVGDPENPMNQWASRGDEDIRTNDTRGAWWEADNLEVLAEHRMILQKQQYIILCIGIEYLILQSKIE